MRFGVVAIFGRNSHSRPTYAVPIRRESYT